MTKVTVVLEYDEDDYPEGVSFGYGMQAEDLPVASVVAVYFGDALEDKDNG